VEGFCFEDECFIQFLPPHSSDQVQPCDVGIFGPMKASIGRICTAPDLLKQSKQVLKILGALQTILLAPIVIQAFGQAGIQSHYSQEHQYLICTVNPVAARCVREVETRGESRKSSSPIAPNRGGFLVA
jgi:hypothetical protein